MSSYTSQTASTIGQDEQTEMDRYIADIVKKFVDANPGVKPLNFHHYTPPADQTTLFRCTPALTGRLYPNPASVDIYVLDFLDNHGARVINETGLTIHDLGQFGFEGPNVYERAGSFGGHQSTVDFFMLNPNRLSEVVDSEKRTLWRISFKYIGICISVPDL